MKTKKIINLLAVAGLSSSLLVACNSGGGNPNNPNTNQNTANNSNAPNSRYFGNDFGNWRSDDISLIL